MSSKPARKRIVIIGRKNVGKSLFIHAFVGQGEFVPNENVGLSSALMEKEMDLPPYGPVLLVDTAGIDRMSDQGQKRLEKTFEIISSADFVIVVLDAREKLSTEERQVFHHLKNSAIHFVAAVNKIEYGINSELINGLRALNIVHFEISCKEMVGLEVLKSRITRVLQIKSVGSGNSKK